MWLELLMMARNSALSALSNNSETGNASGEQYPYRFERRINTSRRRLSAAVVKPDQAGEQYNSLDWIAAVKTWWRDCPVRPCVCSIFRAYKFREHEWITSVTWSLTVSLALTTTPSTVSFSTRGMSTITGGQITWWHLARVRVNIISRDLALFKFRLFSFDQSSMCRISSATVSVVSAGIMR